MRLRRKHILIGIILIFLILLAFYFIGFTGIGYMSTIQFRGFTQIQDNVYIDQSYQKDSAEILSIIDEAKARVSDFWGEPEGKPTIIISGNQKKLAKLGWTGNPALTTTFVLGGAHSYVVVSPNGLNVDVAAHELTHAELHERLYKTKMFPSALVPIWFDEGVAMQNDYREKYNEDAWMVATDNGANITNFADLETAGQFFNKDNEIRSYNYIISRHEVNHWIERHGIEELITLINNVNAGKDFNGLYFAK